MSATLDEMPGAERPEPSPAPLAPVTAEAAVPATSSAPGPSALGIGGPSLLEALARASVEQRASAILSLQRTSGNRSVARLMEGRKPAKELIDKRTSVWGLDEAAVAADLRGKPHDLVVSVLDELMASDDDDDVALEYVRGLTDAQIGQENPAVLERMRTALRAGAVSGKERAQAGRIDKVLGGTAPEGGMLEEGIAVAGDALEALGDAGAEVRRVLDAPVFPVKAIWHQFPENVRLGAVDGLLARAEQLLGMPTDGVDSELLRHFILGAVRQSRSADPKTKLAMADRMADLLGGSDSLTGAVSFAKGLLLGFRDVIFLVPDIVGLLWDGLTLARGTVSQLDVEDIVKGGELLAEGAEAAKDALIEIVEDPAKAAEALGLMLTGMEASAYQASEQAGRGLARVVIDQRDRLTEHVSLEMGRLVGPMILELILTKLAGPVGALLGLAMQASTRFARIAAGTARAARKLLVALDGVLMPLIAAVRGLMRLFKRLRVGQWLEKLMNWLDVLGNAAQAALIGMELHEEGRELADEQQASALPPYSVEPDGVLVLGDDAAGTTPVGPAEEAGAKATIEADAAQELKEAGYEGWGSARSGTELVLSAWASPAERVALIRNDAILAFRHKPAKMRGHWITGFRAALGMKINALTALRDSPDISATDRARIEKRLTKIQSLNSRARASELIGGMGLEDAADQHPELKGGAQRYIGEGSFDLDSVYEVPHPDDPSKTVWKVIEVKGSSTPLSGKTPTQQGSQMSALLGKSRFGEQGSPGYLHGVLTSMRDRKIPANATDDKVKKIQKSQEIAKTLLDAWGRGELEYLMSATAIGPDGVPSHTLMTKFDLGKHARLPKTGNLRKRLEALTHLGKNRK